MTATQPMIEIIHLDGRCRITLAGELDLECADNIAALGCAAVTTSPARDVVLDLSNVTFIDSTAMSALIRIRNTANDRGLSTCLAGTTPQILRVLTLTGLTQIFDLDHTR